MTTGPAASSRYALSFTTGGLLEREAGILTLVYKEHRDWAQVRRLAVEGNLLQARTYSTGVRRARATVDRLSVLSDQEIELFSGTTASERAHLLWVAACRRFDLIGEFAEEVLRERFLALAGSVSYEDYDAFYRAKALWHDELDSVSPTTYKKLRQVLFKMMVEAELLTIQGSIQPALLSARIADRLRKRTPSDIRFFPTMVA
ncbi:DUF1819 family protein [Rathayibacter iranicus]|uniref:Inner membrane protein DUF1819 n=1 Tax=Rathayibacter iranicus NCPPB 2253 = VKM Ac-1602 TaxID=1328868 RepID=A0ABX5LCV1_9MICO|nr:DUF1819 family protein [Rathayibacter iranicus]MWV30483.1 DUF1819 family protein [Rathayibacter iranicus NCPPB 2253 = VKM Ac-1602]PPI51059.1 DUF1819 domain-containing protein [Rathayibacter iranicus]PPI63475.1 DUF1819 domain-containing protein [Rathayibacter iranicus]PPI74185.1 DUF1819 domain-containing protein [Rathayibacter iranicus]PWJ64396.1 putative inner membrane protein DUF1819 [Rathayibacter iranicus NCPPB 2253 = VKM Ac-1602]